MLIKRHAFWPLPACLLLAGTAFAVQPNATHPKADTFVESTALSAAPSLQIYGYGDSAAAGLSRAQSFLNQHGAQWQIMWDHRSDRPHLIQGEGIPLLPTGSRVGAVKLELDDVEPLLRDFMDQQQGLLQVSHRELELDNLRSTSFGDDQYYWAVEFQQIHQGLPVVGANVFFRINHGNIIQFGTDRVADISIDTKPKLTAPQALGKAAQQLAVSVRAIQSGTEPELKIYPALAPGESGDAQFIGVPGSGYHHVLVWETLFSVAGDDSSYKAIVDAHSGEILRLRDENAYAQVTGGVYPSTNTDPEIIRPFPFTELANGEITDSNGDFSGKTTSADLDGRYTKIDDTCGPIFSSNQNGDIKGGGGNIVFGAGNGTDCDTPGIGGAGNTHAARNAFWHLTQINRDVAPFFGGNPWFNGVLEANTNLNNRCNANWNSFQGTVNFYRSGTLNGTFCSNTGEIADVLTHEWGHGLDFNTGGSGSNRSSGEAVGDTVAFLQSRDSCIGENFTPGRTCHNCNSCTGVRELAPFAIGGSATIARPDTIEDNKGINCDRFVCPFNGYKGIMGYQGHCESHIGSTANWDLTQMLVADLGSQNAGYAKMKQLWYGSMVPNRAMFRRASGQECDPNAAVDGCGASNWYTVMLGVDDNDGNLANGTPNGCRIWDAFSAHGIACGARPACSGDNQPPQASFINPPSCSGLQCSFDGRGSTDDNGIDEYLWTFDDGSTLTGSQVSRFMPGHRAHTVTLTVTDGDGETDSVTHTFTPTQPFVNPKRGMWYNPDRSGHGIDFLKNVHNDYVLIWYTYTSSGTPVWYLTDVRPLNGARWSAPLDKVTWNGSSATRTRVGWAGLDFSNRESAWFSWTLDGQSGGERFEFLFGGEDRSGAWYPPSESGWGLQVQQQGTQLGGTVTFYVNGQPRWVQGFRQGVSNNAFIPVRWFNGPGLCPSCSGNTPPTSQPAGSIRLRINSGAGSGTLSTQIDPPFGADWVRANLPISRLTVP